MLAEDPSASKVRVVREYQSDLPPVLADGKLLEQVFFNLLLNAVQAIGGQGTITLRTARGEADATRTDGAPLGPHLEVRVIDTGKIQEQLQEAEARLALLESSTDPACPTSARTRTHSPATGW